ncbi:MAG TPA: V4R domain-containing protein [Gemmatimonadales bacterium]|nr:V4R domain-containing protein [Gemmatimonadales bacterium]
MNPSTLLPEHRCVALGRRALQHLRAVLERDTGFQTATYLQEAGFAGGEELYGAFAAWLRATAGLEHPGEMDVARMAETLSAFFGDLGWGTLTTASLGEAVLAIDTTDWSEATSDGATDYPACHFSTGLLADFLSRLSGESVGVMEVECRSRGDHRCRFLAGAPETLHILYDRMTRGASYQQALGTTS